MSLNDDKDARVWYREPWLWMVLAPLIAVVFSSATMVSIAIKSADDVVSDDYYKEGRLLAQEFTSEDYAKSLNLLGDVTFDWVTHEVLLRLNQNMSFDKITLLVSHPAKAKFDQQLVLSKVSPNLYRSDIDTTLAGRWYLRLSAYKKSDQRKIDGSEKAELKQEEIWRLNGEIDFTNASQVVLE